MSDYIAKHTGGSAFPVPVSEDRYTGEPGMSLRDYFAAQAIGAVIRQCAADLQVRDLLNNQAAGISAAGYLALKAYEIADAMLAERDK